MNCADRVERLDNFHDLSIEYLKTNMVELSFALRSTSTNFVAPHECISLYCQDQRQSRTLEQDTCQFIAKLIRNLSLNHYS